MSAIVLSGADFCGPKEQAMIDSLSTRTSYDTAVHLYFPPALLTRLLLRDLLHVAERLVHMIDSRVPWSSLAILL